MVGSGPGFCKNLDPTQTRLEFFFQKPKPGPIFNRTR